ncbi:ribokinase [Candidatus Gracilibacteria bacterium]|nr:ribokinase [Candidatus Gracilibacteria bacterium]
MANILAIGNPVYDEIRTPFVRTPGRVLSGCSTNGCLALARLGHRATLVGAIGEDLRERFVSDMQRYGVRAYPCPSAQSGGFFLDYDERGDRTLDVLGIADPVPHLPDIAELPDAIIVGPVLQETPLSLIAAIHTASDAPLFLDPQGLLRRIGNTARIEHYCPDDIAALFQLCYVVKANEIEAHILTGVEPRADPAAAAGKLRALGCTIAIVTLAEAGSFIDDGQQQVRIPAYTTLARDPTGAGDTYMAGFLHAYLERPDDLFRAGCYGAATASIWIEHTGPDAPITLAEVERRVVALTSFV